MAQIGLVLHGSRECPFAARVRGLLAHLRVHVQERDVELGSSGPALIDGRLALHDTFAINHYLAEKYGYAGALHEDPAVRARERQDMLRWDAVVAPALAAARRGPLDAGTRRLVAAALDALVQTIHATGGAPHTLLAFHCAPFWARIEQHGGTLADMIAERVLLRRWLAAHAAPAAARP